MQNTETNTQVFTPPEGGFTAEQLAGYETLKITNAEQKQYGDALLSGHAGSRTSISMFEACEKFNQYFDDGVSAGHRAVISATRTGMSSQK